MPIKMRGFSQSSFSLVMGLCEMDAKSQLSTNMILDFYSMNKFKLKSF